MALEAFLHCDDIDMMLDWDNVIGWPAVDHTEGAAYAGTRGLHADTASPDSLKYARKNLAGDPVLAADASIYVGWWHRKGAGQTGTFVYMVAMNLAEPQRLLSYTDLRIRSAVSRAGGISYSYGSESLVVGQWMYLILRMKRSSADGVGDGGMQVWVDGVMSIDRLVYDTFDEAAGTGTLDFGRPVSTTGIYLCDYDEIKIAGTFAEVEAEPESLTWHARQNILIGGGVD